MVARVVVRHRVFVGLPTPVGRNVIPHSGHVPAQLAVTSGCMGQAKAVGASTPGSAGSSFIPHLGHLPAQEATISGCIGQAKTPVSTSEGAMSSSATSASDLVRRRLDVGSHSLPLGHELRARPLGLELAVEPRLRLPLFHRDLRERVRAVGSPVLERELAGLLEEHVDHHPLRRREEDVLDELLALVAAAVAAHELHPGSRQADLEDARVSRIGEIEAHDLADLRAEREVCFPADEEDVAEAAHGHEGRLDVAERSDLPVLEQDVVERERELAVGGRPVVRVRGDDDDVPVQAELLPVVLANVRVVPVDAGIGELDVVGEALADGDRGLRRCVPS